MTPQDRKAADPRAIMWNAVNLRPQKILHDVGLKIVFARFEPDHIARTMNAEVYDNCLLEMYADVRSKVFTKIAEHRAFCLALGYTGLFLARHLDLTAVAGEKYIPFSVSYIPPEADEIVRIGLATRAFPGSHTADDIEYWVEKVQT